MGHVLLFSRLAARLSGCSSRRLGALFAVELEA